MDHTALYSITVAEANSLSCFACGEQNSVDSHFCKFCGRALQPGKKPPSVAQDPLTRILLTLVLVLVVACMLFGMFGLLTSKAGLFRSAEGLERLSPPLTALLDNVYPDVSDAAA